MAENTKLFSSLVKSLILSSHKPQIIFASLGFLLILAGIFVKDRLNMSNSKVETINTMQPLPVGVITNSKIVVDIEGAVKNPGVYHLSIDSRVEDVLNAAGGFKDNADENWINKNLNKASKLTDGQKIYIPDNQQSSVLSAANSDNNTNVAQSNIASNTNTVNINTASLGELENLNGIGQVYGQNIIDHRPYSNIDELTSKKVIPQSTYNKIKDKISVY